MKLRTAGTVMALLAVAVMAAPAGAQVLTNSLPSGMTPAEFAALVWSSSQTVLGLDNFNNTKFTASVSYAIGSIAANPGDYAYFYKVNAQSFALPGDSIGRVTVNFDTSLVKSVGPVLQFGQYENGGNGGNSLVAGPVTPVKLSWDATPNGDGLFGGETTYLWLVSTYPGGIPVSMQLIDGGVGTARVVAPAPEPVSMVLAGLGLTAIAGLRRRA
jgi:hypothetical protein